MVLAAAEGRALSLITRSNSAQWPKFTMALAEALLLSASRMAFSAEKIALTPASGKFSTQGPLESEAAGSQEGQIGPEPAEGVYGQLSGGSAAGRLQLAADEDGPHPVGQEHGGISKNRRTAGWDGTVLAMSLEGAGLDSSGSFLQGAYTPCPIGDITIDGCTVFATIERKLAF